MKLLVTGAFGFTGRHFVKIARTAGHTVSELRANLKDRDALKIEIAKEQPEAVVHLAAISFIGHADESAFHQVNVLGTLNLLDALAALNFPPQNILLASSANVYGNCDRSPIPEEQIPAPINEYAISKVTMENMARGYLDRLPLFFARPFNYTGPGQAESFIIPKLITHFASRAKVIELGNLEVEREFNDVRFVCEAYLRLLHTGNAGEVYNICSGKPVSPKSVIHLLEKLTGYTLQISTNPAWVRTNEVHRLCGDPTKLFRAVGPLPLYDLCDTLEWMLACYKAGIAST